MCASHRPLRLCFVTPRYWLERCFPLGPRANSGSRLGVAAGCRLWMFASSLVVSPGTSGLLVALPLLALSEPPVAILPPVFARLLAGAGFARLPVRVRFADTGSPPAGGGLTTLDLSTVEVPALSSTGTKPLPSAMAPLTAAAVAHAIRMLSSASCLLALKPSAAGVLGWWRV